MLADALRERVPGGVRGRRVRRESRSKTSSSSIEVVADPDRIAMRLAAATARTIHLRLFRSASPIPLSQALPILENMGFVVLSERPYRIDVPSGRAIWLQDFEMQRRDGGTVEPGGARPALHRCVRGGLERPRRERRLQSPGRRRPSMTWRQAMRAARVLPLTCCRPARTFSQSYMEQVLASNAAIAALLSQLFEAQFDPAMKAPRREAELTACKARSSACSMRCSSLDEDRILRRFAGAIQATLRTNYFQTDAQRQPHKSWLSFKLDSRSIPELPQPRPAFEIFVYSPRVEGVHLRMGHVARGGIRWSDRREDFRTEVLGLMKAQNVKNTLIVPVGAKGGFVPKRLPANASREDVQREGVECYRTFIRGLLDLTDNIVDGKLVPPPQVVRRDGDDPYLVVAADKGTATFSDIANRIAAEYDFWLGDAFASGGSAGYDHKKMGITARGGWECVKRHFRELGIDTQSQDFTVDRHRRHGRRRVRQRHAAVAAHQAARRVQSSAHLPRSDAGSGRELRRTRAPVRAAALDLGGLRPQAHLQGRRHLPAQREVHPPVAAGAGHARREARHLHAARADPRDPVHAGRPAVERRHRHVREGQRRKPCRGRRSRQRRGARQRQATCAARSSAKAATSACRSAAASNTRSSGGKLNTDFVDNSGGVDCSDHEVNIKILLNNLPKRAGLTLAEAQQAAGRHDRRSRRTWSCATTTCRARRCRCSKRVP